MSTTNPALWHTGILSVNWNQNILSFHSGPCLEGRAFNSSKVLGPSQLRSKFQALVCLLQPTELTLGIQCSVGSMENHSHLKIGLNQKIHWTGPGINLQGIWGKSSFKSSPSPEFKILPGAILILFLNYSHALSPAICFHRLRKWMILFFPYSKKKDFNS